MQRNKFLVAWLLLLCGVCIGQSAVVFKDSITNVTLSFPDDVTLSDISNVKYKKCDAEASNGNFISVYSVSSTKNQAYGWDYLKKFDENFGDFISEEKFEVAGLEALRRKHVAKQDGGKELITLVTLIRGGNYAMYLVENTFSERSLLTPGIIENSSFPKRNVENRGKRHTTEPTLYLTVFMVLITVLCFLLWYKRHKLSDRVKLLIIIGMPCISFPVMYWLLYYTLFYSIGSAIFDGILFYWVLYSKTADEVWDKIDKTFSD